MSTFMKAYWAEVAAITLFLASATGAVVRGDWPRDGVLLAIAAISLLMVLVNETFSEIAANTWTSGSVDRSPLLVRLGGFVGLALTLYAAW